MPHSSDTTTRNGLRVISQENPGLTTRNVDHLSIVDATGAKIAFTSSDKPQVSTGADCTTAVAYKVEDNWHAADSTYGEAPKKTPLPVVGSFFSNAVNDFLAENPRAKNLRAMTEEFERAFIEAAKNAELGY